MGLSNLDKSFLTHFTQYHLIKIFLKRKTCLYLERSLIQRKYSRLMIRSIWPRHIFEPEKVNLEKTKIFNFDHEYLPNESC